MEKQKCDVSRKFGLANSTIHTMWKKNIKLISAFERNGSRIKRLRKTE